MSLTLLVTTARPSEAASPSRQSPVERPKPVVLLFHPGGYLIGNAASMAPRVAQFEAAGFKALSIEYTLWDVDQARRDAISSAREYGPNRDVFAYGESAGGGLAGLMATRGVVDGAALHSPLVSLTGRWGVEPGKLYGCVKWRCRKRNSPAFHTAKVPVFEMVPLQDTALDPQDALDWAERDPKVRAITYDGNHLSWSPRGQEADVARISRFFWRIAERS